MAKKQSFGDKIKKQQSSQKIIVKVVRSSFSNKTGSLRFSDEVIGVPAEEKVDKFVANYFENSK